MDDSKRAFVKNAAKLAVYDATMMNLVDKKMKYFVHVATLLAAIYKLYLLTNPNNHQVAATILAERHFGTSPPPCGVNEVKQNHKHSLKSKYRLPELSRNFSGLFW